MKSFYEYLNENKGLKYEKAVRRAIVKACSGRPSFVRRSKGGGSFSAHDVDLVANINGQDVPIEIKKNLRAQMGGISVRYDYDSKKLEIKLPKNMDVGDETIELIQESISETIDDLNQVIDWFKKNDPIYHYNKKPGFPLKVSQDAWNDAIDKGVIRSLNKSVEYSSRFIARYYASKQVNYMQIGNAGLFHLDRDVMNIGTPKLEGNINLEFRAGKSGIKHNKTDDYKYSTVILRLQGRLTFKGNSDKTLDTIEGVTKILDKVEK